jgi:hypothetical protein
MKLRIFLKHIIIRTAIYFFLMPLVLSVIDTIEYYWFSNTANDFTLINFLKTSIKEALFSYGGYIYDPIIQVFIGFFRIFLVTFILSILSLKLHLYSSHIFSKNVLTYIFIVMIIMLFLIYYQGTDKLDIVFLVLELLSILYIKYFTKTNRRRIKELLKKSTRLDIWK